MNELQSLEVLTTLDNFKSWLESQLANSIVGECGSFTDCPIATYLKSTGFDNPVVGENGIAELDAIRYQTPEWVESFIKKIDKLADIQVNREQALDILEKVSI